MTYQSEIPYYWSSRDQDEDADQDADVENETESKGKKKKKKKKHGTCLLILRDKFTNYDVNESHIFFCFVCFFVISQSSKKRVKLRQRYHTSRHLMTALCWECMFTEQIASRTT